MPAGTYGNDARFGFSRRTAAHWPEDDQQPKPVAPRQPAPETFESERDGIDREIARRKAEHERKIAEARAPQETAARARQAEADRQRQREAAAGALHFYEQLLADTCRNPLLTEGEQQQLLQWFYDNAGVPNAATIDQASQAVFRVAETRWDRLEAACNAIGPTVWDELNDFNATIYPTDWISDGRARLTIFENEWHTVVKL
jgi:hypothetical protein